MKPVFATYLLVSGWAWDPTHKDYATLTVPRSSEEFETVIADATRLRRVVHELRDVARAQNRAPGLGGITLISLSRALDCQTDVEFRGESEPEQTEGQPFHMVMQLRLICTFDEHDHITLIPA